MSTFTKRAGTAAACIFAVIKRAEIFSIGGKFSGGNEINIVVCVNGGYAFPSLKTLYKKEYRAFNVKHFFKKPTVDERRKFVAELLCKELNSGKPDFFGIKL